MDRSPFIAETADTGKFKGEPVVIDGRDGSLVEVCTSRRDAVGLAASLNRLYRETPWKAD